MKYLDVLKLFNVKILFSRGPKEHLDIFESEIYYIFQSLLCLLEE